MTKKERFGLVLTPKERTAVRKMAEAEDLSAAAIVRRLIRLEAQRRGWWPDAYEPNPKEAAHA